MIRTEVRYFIMLQFCMFLLFSSIFCSAQKKDLYQGKHFSHMFRKKKQLYSHKKFKGKYLPELESKVTFSGFAGVLFPLGGREVSPGGVAENIFGNFSLSPTIGGGVFYNRTNKISFGSTLQYTNLFSNIYNMNLVVLKPNFKYSFVASDRKVSPYVTVGLCLSLASLKQKSHTYDYYPAPSYSVKGDNDIPVTKIHFREPNISVAYIPIAGFALGAGTDILLKKNLNLFLQADYSFNFTASSSQIQKYYPYNKANFRYLLFTAGLKFKILQNKSLY